MSEMKCPFCQQELRITSYYDTEIHGCYCDKCGIFGDLKLWQELIRARKALDVAVGALKSIKAYYDDSYADPHTFVNWHSVAQRLANDADDASKAITTLEQKE